MEIRWNQHALEDRILIFGFIASDNPQAAVKTDEQISNSVSRLAEHPELGRMGRVTGTRELVIPATPYLAAYKIVERNILILRILHGAQMWPETV